VSSKQKFALRKITSALRESESQKSNLLSELQQLRVRYDEDTAQGDDITYGLEKDRTRLRQGRRRSNETSLSSESDSLICLQAPLETRGLTIAKYIALVRKPCPKLYSKSYSYIVHRVLGDLLSVRFCDRFPDHWLARDLICN
jgi:hypothetical protein